MQILVLQQCCFGIEQILSAWIDFHPTVTRKQMT
jgi:hypothetical protein